MNDAEFMVHNTALEALLRMSGRSPGLVGQQFSMLFRRLTLRSNITRVIEVGAFEAAFSRWWKHEFPDADALAYEANPFVYEQFREAVTSAGVRYRGCCVADTPGHVALNVPRDFRGSSRDKINRISSLSRGILSEATEVVEVPSVRLDDDAAVNADDRISMWVDVEGACRHVLPSAHMTLARTVLLNIEVETGAMWQDQWLAIDVHRFLRDCGFSLLARDIQRPNQHNALYVNDALFDTESLLGPIRNFLLGRGRFAADRVAEAGAAARS